MRRTLMPVVLLALASIIAVSEAGAQTDSTALLRRGQRVWEKKECAACHGIDATGGAPALGGVTRRRSREWLYGWLNDSKKMAREDSTAKALVAVYGEWVMPKKGLSPKDVDAVLSFIEYRAAKIRVERGLR
jgi:mono/diheme cytochrome c family protein